MYIDSKFFDFLLIQQQMPQARHLKPLQPLPRHHRHLQLPRNLPHPPHQTVKLPCMGVALTTKQQRREQTNKDVHNNSNCNPNLSRSRNRSRNLSRSRNLHLNLNLNLNLILNLSRSRKRSRSRNHSRSRNRNRSRNLHLNSNLNLSRNRNRCRSRSNLHHPCITFTVKLLCMGVALTTEQRQRDQTNRDVHNSLNLNLSRNQSHNQSHNRNQHHPVQRSL